MGRHHPNPGHEQMSEKAKSVQQRRQEKGWSQEHLAQISGLSVRTIQRIENGHSAGLDSLKALAAVFETDISMLTQEKNVTDKTMTSKRGREEAEARDYVDNLKGFHMNWISFVIIIPCLYLLNRFMTPDETWIAYVIIPWLAAIGLHWVVIYGLFENSALAGRNAKSRSD